MNDDSAEAQALRLLKAFYGVHDQESRGIIITLVESAARGAKITAGSVDSHEPATADLN